MAKYSKWSVLVPCVISEWPVVDEQQQGPTERRLACSVPLAPSRPCRLSFGPPNSLGRKRLVLAALVACMMGTCVSTAIKLIVEMTICTPANIGCGHIGVLGGHDMYATRSEGLVFLLVVGALYFVCTEQFAYSLSYTVLSSLFDFPAPQDQPCKPCCIL